MAKIVLENVSKRYAGRGREVDEFTAVSGVGFSVADTEIIALVGPSGCGKSTVMNMIAGFEMPSTGRISVSGELVKGAGPNRMVVFQSPALFPWMTVTQNIVFGPRKQGVPKNQYLSQAEEFIRAVDLERFSLHYPYQLSGGMRQRVQIARALMSRPDVLLMDEPFGALDSQTRLSMQELLLQVWSEFHPTILFITHDVEEAVFLGDRVFVMSRNPGRIKEEISVPFDKPRTFELTTTPEFVAIKDHVLHLIRSEMCPQP